MCGCAHVHAHVYLEGKPTVSETIKEVFMLQQVEDYVCGSYVFYRACFTMLNEILKVNG